jgi:broad specificity phosphatase PhoE
VVAQLTLIRHGRSAYAHGGGWLDAAGVAHYCAGYDAAGIVADEEPPPAVRQLVEEADAFVASDLQRARESAERLAPGRAFHTSPLLREWDMDAPARIPVRLPIATWDVVDHLVWSYRLWRGSSARPELHDRAAEAAEWLMQLSREHRHTAAVTHGGFRRLLTAHLMHRGWRETSRRSYANWSAWRLEL